MCKGVNGSSAALTLTNHLCQDSVPSSTGLEIPISAAVEGS
jgi:hypothetical protein